AGDLEWRRLVFAGRLLLARRAAEGKSRQTGGAELKERTPAEKTVAGEVRSHGSLLESFVGIATRRRYPHFTTALVPLELRQEPPGGRARLLCRRLDDKPVRRTGSPVRQPGRRKRLPQKLRRHAPNEAIHPPLRPQRPRRQGRRHVTQVARGEGPRHHGIVRDIAKRTLQQRRV